MVEKRSNINPVFGYRLKKTLKEKGIMQADLAAKVSLSPATICMYCEGKRMPKVENLIKVAIALNKSLDYLLGIDCYI